MHTSLFFNRRIGLLAIACAFFLHMPTVSGCGASAEEVVETGSDIAAFAALPPAREEALGEQMRTRLREERDLSMLSEDEYPDVNQYVQRLGEQAVAEAEKIDGKSNPGSGVFRAIDFNFHVIDAPNTVNAFAIAGGEIYVYSGLLLKADSEAEVMSVMSHEVAHVTERHIAKQMVAAYGLQFAAEKASEQFKKAADGQASELIDFFVKRVATKGVILAYGRKQENDADEKGVAYMTSAGYDPQGFISFFEKLQSAQGATPPKLFSSHPPPGNRIENVRKLVDEKGYGGNKVGESSHQTVERSLQ